MYPNAAALPKVSLTHVYSLESSPQVPSEEWVDAHINTIPHPDSHQILGKAAILSAMMLSEVSKDSNSMVATRVEQLSGKQTDKKGGKLVDRSLKNPIEGRAPEMAGEEKWDSCG